MIQYKEVLTDSKSFNCLTSTLATLCKEQHMNFEYMFLEDWQFSFDTYKGDRLGGIVHKNDVNYYDLLLKYGGIQVNETAMDDLPMFKAHLNKTEAENGLAIIYDTFYCPWVYNYQKEHQKHYSLALGFEGDGSFFCCDTVPYSEQTELPISDLFQSTFSAVSVQKSGGVPSHCDYAGVIKQYAKSNLESGGSIPLLKDYAHLLEQEFCVEKENLYCGTNSWVRAPFLIDIEWVARSRAAFHLVLEYLTKIYDGNQFFQNAAEQFAEISNNWYTTFLSCWKMFLMPAYCNTDARKELSEAIRQMAACEEAAAASIMTMEG